MKGIVAKIPRLRYNWTLAKTKNPISTPEHKLSGGVCIRCGKSRIIIDTYEERIETSFVTYTITSCIDPDCQKIVDKLLKDDEKKRKEIKKEQERRELQRKEAIAARKLANAK